jgi:spore germination protein KB
MNITVKNKDSIGSGQMAVLFFIFSTGSSIINIPGPLIGVAKNAAWVSLLISLCGGILILLCMLYLQRLYPGMSFMDISNKTVGSWLTAGMVFLTVIFMLHMCTGIVIDVGLFLKTSMMRETPLYIFYMFILVLVAATVRCGLNVMARMFIMLIITVMLFTIAVWLLAIPDYQPHLLLPVMPDGIKPILHGAFIGFGFPYEEIFLFVFMFPYVKQETRKGLSRNLLLALLINGTTLVISAVSTIMIFGPMAGERKYSLYEVARTIEVQEIIQRIESVVGMSLIAGSFMKTAITLFILNKVCNRLFRIQSDKLLVYPLAFISFVLALNFKGDARWVDIVSHIHPLWAAVSMTIPLLLVTLTAAVRNRFQKSADPYA